MALWSPSTSLVSSLQFHINSSISIPNLSKTLFSKTPISRISEIPISASPNFSNPNPSFRKFHCCTSSSSLIEPDKSPSTIVFLKGLPQSTSEGTLKTAFSQFGEVNRVKIITDKKSKLPLGFAYVWFSCEESAQMAVKEMNGKLFDDTSIVVTIAKPGSCKTGARVNL
ncbi:organelle RRM domain-containing protein 2, mitochondrial [Actinidia eriantha]|uniref:organelle RRM domain-containing protein 2, mitochondrial n=1 Tax=Actinidia eriantha TaxID=165200 RepID=UPI00258F8C8A|nr:organelle RRM domain-containing protein 2, mitochondrial [Actinidia eriantha]